MQQDGASRWRHGTGGCSGRPARPQPHAKHHNGPKEIKYERRGEGSGYERVSGVRGRRVVRWWPYAGDAVQRLEHDRLCRRPTHGSMASDLVPHFAIMVARPSEKATAARGVLHVYARQGAAELAENTALEIGEARIFGREIDSDMKRSVNRRQGALVGGRERIAAILAHIPARAWLCCYPREKRRRDNDERAAGYTYAAPPADAQPETREDERARRQHERHEHDREANLARLERAE